MTSQSQDVIRPCFTLRNVVHRFEVAGQSITALNDLSVTIPAGSCVAILGPSGAGKTSLLKLLGLLAEPSAAMKSNSQADILFHDEAAWSYCRRSDSTLRPVTAADRDRLRRTRFGFVFQGDDLLEHLTCAENVSLGLTLDGVARRQRLSEAKTHLTSLGLGAMADRLPRRLSGGERKRVAVLKAIVHRPRVVFADEPTAHLDTAMADAVLTELCDWQRRGNDENPHTLLLVTHHLPVAWNRCDWFLILRDGRAIDGDGNPIDSDATTSGHCALLKKGRDIQSADDLVRLVMQTSDSITKVPETSVVEADPKWHSKGRPRFHDLCSLALRDLFRRGERWVNTVTSATLVLLFTLCLLGWSMLEAKRRVMQREFDSRWSKSLEVAAYGDDGLDDGSVDQLAESQFADGRPIFPNGRDDIWRWNTARLEFMRTEAGDHAAGEPLGRFVSGRTMLPGDPLFDTLHSANSSDDLRISGSNQPEIIVTESLLRECQCPGAPCPPDAFASIWISYANQHTPLTIVGVVESIPGGYEYIVPDGFWQLCVFEQYEPPDPLVGTLYLTPVKRHEWDQFQFRDTPTSGWQQSLELFDLRAEPAGEGRIVLTPRGGGRLRLAFFRDAANRLAEELESSQVISTEITVAEPSGQANRVFDPVEISPALSRRVTYTTATLYLSDLNDLEAVVELVESYGLKVDRGIVEAKQQMQRTIEPLTWMLTSVVAIALFIGSLNVGITMWLRVRRRRREIGLLKASGMRTRHLLIVYLVQTIFIAIAVWTAGTACTWVSGHGIDLYARSVDSSGEQVKSWTKPQLLRELWRRMARRQSETEFFVLNERMLAASACAMLGLCAAAGVTATIGSARMPPAEAISE